MLDEGTPDIQFVHFDSVQEPQVFFGIVEHRPLLTVKVSADGEGEAGDGVELPRVQNLDPHIGGAIESQPSPLRPRGGCEERTGQGPAGGD